MAVDSVAEQSIKNTQLLAGTLISPGFEPGGKRPQMNGVGEPKSDDYQRSSPKSESPGHNVSNDH